MYINFNICLEMLRREIHDNMMITDKHITALLDSIEAVNKLDAYSMSDSVYDDLAKLSCKVDRLTMDLREALISFHSELQILGNNPPELPMEDPPKLEISVDGPDVRIELDGILPFALSGSVYYLHEKLDTALARYRDENSIPRPLFSERCAVVFIHHYKQERKAVREMRDYDNLERRCILNVLCRHFLRDDSPACCISMDALAPGERNYTEIRLMTLARFREYVMSEDIEYTPQGTMFRKAPSAYSFKT